MKAECVIDASSSGTNFPSLMATLVSNTGCHDLRLCQSSNVNDYQHVFGCVRAERQDPKTPGKKAYVYILGRLPRLYPDEVCFYIANPKVIPNPQIPTQSKVAHQKTRKYKIKRYQSLTFAPIPPPTNQTSSSQFPILTPTVASAPSFKLPPSALLTAS